jgi:hypothetical protein
MSQETTTLYRPVGQRELDLIAASGYVEFPTRLEWQPFLYLVLNEEFASLIAQEWNTKDEAYGFVGHVLRFEVKTEHLTRYRIQKVIGSATFTEYWIPSEELIAFNRNIVGKIEIVSTYRGTLQEF